MGKPPCSPMLLVIGSLPAFVLRLKWFAFGCNHTPAARLHQDRHIRWQGVFLARFLAMVRLGGNLPPNFGFTRRLELLLMAAGMGNG